MGKGPGRYRYTAGNARLYSSLGIEGTTYQIGFDAVRELLGPGRAATDAVFTVLKGPRRGLPLSAAGLDEILDGARGRAGLAHATCHQLRHTCLTQLRKAGMSLEAVQAQAGHASIEAGPHLPAPRR